MMKKLLFSFFAAMLLFTSCGPDLIKFNDTIIEQHTKVTAIKEALDDKITAAANANNLSSIKADVDSALVKIDACIATTNALETPSGGEDFKNSAIELFESVKKVVELGNKFAAVSGEDITDSYNKLVDEQSALIDEASKKEDIMIQNQQKFAQDKNVRLENK